MVDPKDNEVQSDCANEEAHRQKYADDCEIVRREYLKAPTLETYVRLRGENPLIDFDVSSTGGFGWVLESQEEILRNGLDLEPALGCLDAERKCQEQIALALIRRIIERKDMVKAGETHVVSLEKAISDTFVNYCIAWCLEAVMKLDGSKIANALMVLIKYQLGVTGSDCELENGLVLNKEKAIHAAVRLKSRGVKPTYRRIGDLLGVNASTVMRWFPDRDLDKEIGKFISLLSSYGQYPEQGN